jgi:tight adherence protein B
MRGGRESRLQQELNRAGLTLRAPEFIGIRVGLAALAVALMFLRFGGWILPLVGAVIGWFLPSLWLRRRQAKRRNMFDAQLGDTVLLLSNGLKAGYSIQQALVSVVEGGQPPLSDEIARVVREMSLGLDMEAALEHSNQRIESKDFDMLVTAILIHRTVGGNLAEVLEKIAGTVRERVRLHGEVRVLTAQARASGYIITGLPFAVAAILAVISPSFERPLFTNPLGWVMIVFGLIMIAIGYSIIRRITNIKI